MDVYTDTLLRTISKIYKLPHQRAEYAKIKHEVSRISDGLLSTKIDRQDAVDSLQLIISKLEKLPPRHGRVDERILNIINFLEKQKSVPKTILDIGAGTGEILIALKNHYRLDSSMVYAIDQKLPKLSDVTPLTYDSGKIPLPDRSVDVIVMLMVLHHIPIQDRLLIISEMSRVLSVDGVIIIREHDDNKDPKFHTFLDFIHLFWYIASDETQDPLYLLSQQETTNLFDQAGLKSIQISKYPEPNPQQIYHEVFVHRPSIHPYEFKDSATKAIVQSYIDRIRLAPPTYESFMELIPSNLISTLRDKYHVNIERDMLTVWPDIIKQVGIAILSGAIKYTAPTNGVRYLTTDSIIASIKDLG
jgi:SAM-dependent methyltransferase